MTTPNSRRYVKDALTEFTVQIEPPGPLSAEQPDYFTSVAAQGGPAGRNPLSSSGFFFGQVENFTMPDLKRVEQIWNSMGDGELTVEMGLQRLELMFTSKRFHPGLRATFGQIVQVVLKSGLLDGSTRKYSQYTIIGTGEVTGVTGSQVKQGEIPEGISLTLNCHQYKEIYAGRDLEGVLLAPQEYIDIDIVGLKRGMLGQGDHLREIRDFLLGSSSATASSV